MRLKRLDLVVVVSAFYVGGVLFVLAQSLDLMPTVVHALEYSAFAVPVVALILLFNHRVALRMSDSDSYRFAMGSRGVRTVMTTDAPEAMDWILPRMEGAVSLFINALQVDRFGLRLLEDLMFGRRGARRQVLVSDWHGLEKTGAEYVGEADFPRQQMLRELLLHASERDPELSIRGVPGYLPGLVLIGQTMIILILSLSHRENLSLLIEIDPLSPAGRDIAIRFTRMSESGEVIGHSRVSG